MLNLVWFQKFFFHFKRWKYRSSKSEILPHASIFSRKIMDFKVGENYFSESFLRKFGLKKSTTLSNLSKKANAYLSYVKK